MRLYRHLSEYRADLAGIALAIGNFDGFHLGHQAVITAMQEQARLRHLHSAVMIFEPQPLEFFGKAVPPRLYSLRDKLKAFEKSGVELVFCVSFTQDFGALSAAQFVHLLHALNVKAVVVGSLFSFGKNGSAVFADLERLCAARGIYARAINAVAQDGVRISSTQIRALLAAGDLRSAAAMLGRPFSMSGRVVHGQQLGRTLGFPTANVNLRRRVSPLNGVYAVKVRTRFGYFSGMANVGARPTVNGARSLLEVHLFDFNADLYGSEIEVYFLHKLRAEEKFTSLQALQAQLSRDCRQAREWLQTKADAVFSG